MPTSYKKIASATSSAASTAELSVLIAKREADIAVCPEPLAIEAGYVHISIGDLHANAMKLIYVLIEEGILKLDSEQYNKLYKIYSMKASDLRKEDIDEFRSVLDSAPLNNSKTLMLIGDELSDRGSNDFFMLLMIKKLSKARVHVEILLSNHGADFIYKLYGKKASIHSSTTGSNDNMRLLVARKIITDIEINQIVNEYYFPMIRALSYSISNKRALTLYSHAPIGLETVEVLAEILSVFYDDTDQLSLMRTIDAINARIQQLLNSALLDDILKNDELAVFASDHFISGHPIPLCSPFYRLIWNRELGEELRMESKNGSFKVTDVHGHIGEEPLKDKDGSLRATHQCLDNHFGKDPSYTQTRALPKIEHFTRRSADSIQSQLYALWDGIQTYELDKSMFKNIKKDVKNIESTTDVPSLLYISARLNGIMNRYNLVKNECYLLIKEIQKSSYATTDFLTYITERLAKETRTTELQQIRDLLDIHRSQLRLYSRLESMTKLDIPAEYLTTQTQRIKDATNKPDLDQITLELDQKIEGLSRKKTRMTASGACISEDLEEGEIPVRGLSPS